jgi:uncharacterized protein YodC (DUF2158 family)
VTEPHEEEDSTIDRMHHARDLGRQRRAEEQADEAKVVMPPGDLNEKEMEIAAALTWPWQRITERELLSVACPTCRALSGDRCTAAGGSSDSLAERVTMSGIPSGLFAHAERYHRAIGSPTPSLRPNVPMAQMRCSACSHMAGLHEILTGPCHHGEGTGERCTCAGFGGTAFVPKEGEVVTPEPPRPPPRGEQRGQPLRGPHKSTLMHAEIVKAEYAAEASASADRARSERLEKIEALVTYIQRCSPPGVFERGTECEWLDENLENRPDWPWWIEPEEPAPVDAGRGRDNAKFQPGDLVQLVSGGPEMTVLSVDDKGVAVSFFDGDDFPRVYVERIFPAAALVKSRLPPRP